MTGVTNGSLAQLDPAGVRKARGAFFTPAPVARYITDWAIRAVDDQMLEPSCGEAAFLLAAVDRLAALRGPTDPADDWWPARWT